MGYGDMVCLSRCPPTAPAPGQNCYTLPDASDPCCNITVCDKPVPDPDQNVPKENQESKQPRVINEFELTEAFPGKNQNLISIQFVKSHVIVNYLKGHFFHNRMAIFS